MLPGFFAAPILLSVERCVDFPKASLLDVSLDSHRTPRAVRMIDKITCASYLGIFLSILSWHLELSRRHYHRTISGPLLSAMNSCAAHFTFNSRKRIASWLFAQP